MAGTKTEDNNLKSFEKWVYDKNLLIADPSASSRAGLAKTLVGMGAKTQHITLAPTYEIAEEEIKRINPHVVLCEYELGRKCGLELLQVQREQRLEETKNSLFILVTGNSSQSAVAQAAEEDVDTFVLKPYTIDMLRQSIMNAAIAKLYPSDYQKTINEGKKLLLEKYDPKAAMVIFEKAMAMDPKPALACFYHGHAQTMLNAFETAQYDFKKGLDYNKIHYKCMVGLYDVLMQQKLHDEAYDVIKRIARYFPANPKRLASVLRLAIVTKNYDDIERYYQIFIGMDFRDDMLVKYVCAAMVVTGKFYLRKNINSRALELFTKAAVTGAGRTNILREIITELATVDLKKNADDFLRRFPAETHKSIDYTAMNLLVADMHHPGAKIIEIGRKLISEGNHDPMIYRIVIKRSIEFGKMDAAENLAREGEKRWPDKKEELWGLINNKVIVPSVAPEYEKVAK